MKNLFILLGIFAVLFSSCDREIFPHAGFSVNYDLVEPYELVEFTSTSSGAKYHTWDFGDGYTSTAVHPTHDYEYEGNYTVTLTVESVDGHIDVASMRIEVIYTELIVTVTDWDTEDVIEGALVVLYETLADWEYDENAVDWYYTNSYGEVSFFDLYEKGYYVWSEAIFVDEIYNNSSFNNSNDRHFLLTPIVRPLAKTYHISWIDYYGPYKKNKGSRYEKYKDKEKDKSRLRKSE